MEPVIGKRQVFLFFHSLWPPGILADTILCAAGADLEAIFRVAKK